ncbi:MAG: hypothetical protein AAF446_07355 [Pseudomonadota bacterium]
MKPPVLIDIELIGSGDAIVDPQIMPSLAELNQADRSLVLLARRPDGWKPTRNRVDQAFKLQSDIEAMVNRGGGMLDAILYLDFSLFSRQKQRKAALIDLAARYGCEMSQMTAICRADGRITDTLAECEIPLQSVDNQHSLKQRIGQILAKAKVDK